MPIQPKLVNATKEVADLLGRFDAVVKHNFALVEAIDNAVEILQSALQLTKVGPHADR